MKKTIAIALALSLLLLGGCGSAPEETVPTTIPVETTEAPTTVPTEAPTTAPTEVPTEAPTEPPVSMNPLTGEPLDEPYDGRIFAVTINNVPQAMPHYGVSLADIYFEMYVNSYATRGLALYADVTEAESIGSVRSLRYNFTDICQAYNAIVVHAMGSDHVLKDKDAAGIDNISAEEELGDYYYRDYERVDAGYFWEQCLFVKGPELKEYAAQKGFAVSQEPGIDYGLHFTENAQPANGEVAGTVSIDFRLNGARKNTTMVYDEATGLYIYNQYDASMKDHINQQPEAFKNVIVMVCDVQTDENGYHVANLLSSGEGYFACEGKLLPIQWSRSADNEPFSFTLTDGTPLELGIGSSYIAIVPMESTIGWE